jgi:hypothetical protein
MPSDVASKLHLRPFMGKFRNRFFEHQLAALFIICLAASTTARAQASAPVDESWTSSSQNLTADANPYRTKESHLKSGNKTLDEKTVEVRGSGGSYQLYYRTETETIQENPTLTRSTTRTYNPGGDRNEHLTQIIEVETRASDDGSRTVKTISNANLDGKFELKAREISVTEKSSDLRKTQTTLYLPSISSEFAPSMQVNEQQRQNPNGTIETKKETLFPDLNGRWETYEVREQTVTGDSHEQITDERLSRRDFEGNVSLISEVTSKDTNDNGHLTRTIQTYSVDVPGSTRDHTLHPVQSSTTVQTKEAGRIVTETEVTQPDTIEKGSNTVVNTMDVVVKKSSGTEELITVTARYPNGYPSVVLVETRRTEGQH